MLHVTVLFTSFKLCSTEVSFEPEDTITLLCITCGIFASKILYMEFWHVKMINLVFNCEWDH